LALNRTRAVSDWPSGGSVICSVVTIRPARKPEPQELALEEALEGIPVFEEAA